MFRVVALFAISWSACAQTDLLAGGSWSLARPNPNAATLATTDFPESPGGFAQGLRLEVASLGTDPWSIQLSHTVSPPVRQNDPLRYRLWARSGSRMPIELVFEKNGSPYTQSLRYLIAASPEWTEYAIPFRAVEAYAGTGAAVRIRAGYKTGEVELAGIRLESWPDSLELPRAINFNPWGPQAHDDSWREAAADRIRAHRMGGLAVEVVDAAGNPVPGATVKIEQQSHAFRFGSAITNGPLFASTPDGDRYRATFLRLFNYAVLENQLKWTWPGFETADNMLAWCAQNNIPVRGHTLLWPSYQYLPASVRALRGEPMRQAVQAHVVDYVTRTRGRVVVWDVINEAVTNTEVLRDSGRDLLWLPFHWARQHDPDVELAYNDYDLSNNRAGANDRKIDQVIAIVKELKANDAHVTVLGDQGHISAPVTPGAKLIEIWDRLYAELELPIEITEFDIGFGGIIDEKAQADYLDEYLTAAFSHPRIRSVLMWGFWAGAHWREREGGAIFNRDWTPRLTAQKYEKLVFGDWWTRAETTTGEDGVAAIRAFLGAHRITVTIGDVEISRTVELARNGDEVTSVRFSLE